MDASWGENRENGRLLWLDFGKATGIVVVLLVHAGCSLGAVTFYGGMFYMPIFFVAAGYTYHQRKEESLRAYCKRKAKRLLLPYLGSSVFLWLFFWMKDSLLAGNPLALKWLSLLGILYSRNQMYRASYPKENPVLLDVLNSPLWFLTAMFLTYLWYEIASRSGKKMRFLAVGAAVSLLWHYGTELLLPWSLDAVPYFACLMAAGEEFRERKLEKLLGEVWFLGILIVVFLFASNLNGSMNLSCGEYGNLMVLSLLCGATGSLLVFAAGMWLEKRRSKALRILALVGRETLGILCFHMFLYLFLQTGAEFIGLPGWLTKAVMVAGSLVVLTAVSYLLHRKQGRERT